MQEEKRITQEIELLVNIFVNYKHHTLILKCKMTSIYLYIFFFQSYLNKLIFEDSQRQIRKVKKTNGTDGNDEDSQNKIMELELKCVCFILSLNLSSFFDLYMLMNLIYFCRIIVLAN